MAFGKSGRGIMIVIILLVTLAVGAWAMLGRTGGAAPANTVRVASGSINATIEAVGRVRPLKQAQLAMPVGGRVTEVLVRPGDVVQAGQALVSVEQAPIEREIQQAQLELNSRRQRLDQARAGATPTEIEGAQAALREATVAREVAQASYDERDKKPDATTSVEAAQLEAAKAAYQRARATLERALTGATADELAILETSVTQGELGLQASQERLAQTRLTAPFAGVVLTVNTRVDEIVGNYHIAVLLADLTTMYVEVEVEEVDAPTVQAGQTAEIRLDAFPGETLQGTVNRIAPSATTDRGAVSYTAWLDLASTTAALRPGLSATAKIATRTKTGVLLVPARAVTPIGRQKIVKVVRGGRMVETEVVTGLTDKQTVEIVEGLVEGDLVVVE